MSENDQPGSQVHVFHDSNLSVVDTLSPLTCFVQASYLSTVITFQSK